MKRFVTFLFPALLLTFILSLLPPNWRLAWSADSARAPAQAAPPTATFGVNLCGAEFGEQSLPGTFGHDYTYPTSAELDYYQSKGITLVRLPFRWERMQRELFAPLDRAELARLDGFLAEAGRRGMRVILDLHNFARYRRDLIGSPDVPIAAFADFWRKMAQHCESPTHANVANAVWAYGLMNEPHDTEGFWPIAAQAAVEAIRGVDRRRLILVCGEGWANTHVWAKYNPDLNVIDPAHHFLYEGHLYFDHDATGLYAKSYDDEKITSSIGIERVKPFLQWLAAHHAGGFIGEFGVPATDDNATDDNASAATGATGATGSPVGEKTATAADARWLAALDQMLGFLRDQGISGCYWAGGPWWKQYPLSIEPRAGQDRPQMAVLAKYTQSARSVRDNNNADDGTAIEKGTAARSRRSP